VSMAMILSRSHGQSKQALLLLLPAVARAASHRLCLEQVAGLLNDVNQPPKQSNQPFN
jgi:hypothetical protein